ncbi:MAG: glycoside hydrolase family 25 protein, partial [Mucilaginibacter sp.]
MTTGNKKSAPAKKAPSAKTPAPKRKYQPKKKKTNAFTTKWKIALAGLLLILLSPFYYGYVIKAFTSTWRW